jgi:hypothetical protein
MTLWERKCWCTEAGKGLLCRRKKGSLHHDHPDLSLPWPDHLALTQLQYRIRINT